MSPRTKTPPPAHVARLQPAWQATAVHEAGHAVAGVLLDIPLLEVWIAYQKQGWSGWSVIGRTETVIDGEEPPPGEMSEADLNDAILFAWAGLEAEAMWLVGQGGGRLAAARRSVASVRVHQLGDLAALRGYHKDRRARWSERKAQDLANGLLRAHWPAVEHVAGQLMVEQALSGKQVSRFV